MAPTKSRASPAASSAQETSSSSSASASLFPRRKQPGLKKLHSYIALLVLLLGVALASLFLRPQSVAPILPSENFDTRGFPEDLPQENSASGASGDGEGESRRVADAAKEKEEPRSFEEVAALLGGEEVKAAATTAAASSVSPPPPAKRSIIEVDEAPECQVPRPLQPCRIPPRSRIHVVFVSAMWYREPFTKDETENMLKTIFYGTLCRLHIHFMVSGEPEVSGIHRMMRRVEAVETIPVPAPFAVLPGTPLLPEGKGGYLNASLNKGADVLYSLHYIPEEWVLERAKALDLFPLAHHAGVPGMSKFFMPDILWQVKRAIYLDVDMVLAGDIQDLWEYFREIEDSKPLLYFMGNNHPEGHNRRRLLRPFCSCQMVLDLEKMRKANLTQLLVSALKGQKPKELPAYVEDGDQWLFQWVCKQYKQKICRILPRMWNVSGCSKPVPFLGLNSHGKEANGSCWRIVHFNCMGHIRNKGGRYNIPGAWYDALHWSRHLKLEYVRRRNRHSASNSTAENRISRRSSKQP